MNRLSARPAAVDCKYSNQMKNVYFFTQLEDYIPEVEEFYRKNHSGRKLQWHHLMSNGVVGACSFRCPFITKYGFNFRPVRNSLFPSLQVSGLAVA